MKVWLKKLKSYAKTFIKEEDGMEFLQIAIIVALVAALIAVITYLFTVVSEKIGEAGDSVDSMDTTPNVHTNPNNANP